MPLISLRWPLSRLHLNREERVNLIDRMIDQLHSFFVDFNYGYAPVKRARWSAPAIQQTLLLHQPSIIVILTIIDFETKEAVALPGLTIMFFQRLCAGNGASKMPTCGHAPVKRTKWLAPAAQQTLLLVESIQQQKPNAAGSYYRVLPQVACRQEAISLAGH